MKDPTQQEQVHFAAVEDFLNWGKENSLFYLLFATACCGIEMMQTGGPRYDVDRLGMIPRATPRQADLMIVAGTITHKMASRVRLLYEQMTEPRWVISMGSCANAGGPFSKYSYSVLNGIDKHVPVDIYVPGCPPRPEALIDGCNELRKKVRKYRTLGIRDRSPVTIETTVAESRCLGGEQTAVAESRSRGVAESTTGQPSTEATS